jgi:hypothetical protein
MTIRSKFVLAMLLGMSTACDGGETKPGDPKAAAPAAELTADQVVARHFDAIGGLAKIKAMKSLAVKGEYTEDGKTNAWAMVRARPNKFRKEGSHDGKAFVKLFDGAQGYMSEAGAPLAPVPADKAAKMVQWSEFDDPMVDAAIRGHKLELGAAEDVKGARAHHVQLTLASGDVEHRYYDAASFLEVQRRVTYKDKDGAEKTKTIHPSDWREVNGVKFSFASDGEVDGKKTRSIIKELVVDGPIDPQTFAAPATNVVAAAP